MWEPQTPSVIVFFKQKTEYEVRISVWSSDVCSSDLHYGMRWSVSRKQACLTIRILTRQPPPSSRRWPKASRSPDRKSVVSGKSVSVRVDLGGRRIIKYKNTNTHYNSPNKTLAPTHPTHTIHLKNNYTTYTSKQ